MNVLSRADDALRVTPPTLQTELSTAYEVFLMGESTHTLRSYRSALRYWATWYQFRYGGNMTLPVDPEVVVRFISDHAKTRHGRGFTYELPASVEKDLIEAGLKRRAGPAAYSTILHRLAVLSKIHQLYSKANPYLDERVTEVLARARDAYTQSGALPRTREVLNEQSLAAVLATCDSSSLRDLRDRAVLLFICATGGRRSLVASADMRFLSAGPRVFTYQEQGVPSHRDSDQPPHQHRIAGAAALALRAWLKASGITEGRLFRGIHRSLRLGASLSGNAVNQIVQARCTEAGLQGQFSVKSLRAASGEGVGRRGHAA